VNEADTGVHADDIRFLDDNLIDFGERESLMGTFHGRKLLNVLQNISMQL
jgi:hypothetical protein